MHSYLEGPKLTTVFAAGGFDGTLQEIRRVLYAAKAASLRTSLGVQPDPDLEKQLKELQSFAIYLETLANEPDPVFDQDPAIRQNVWAMAAQCYEYLAESSGEWLPPRALLAIRGCLCYSKAGLASNAALMGKRIDTTEIGINLPEEVVAYLCRDYATVERILGSGSPDRHSEDTNGFSQLLESYMWKNVSRSLQLHVTAIRRGFSNMEQLLSEQIAPGMRRAGVFAKRLSAYHYWLIDDLAAIIDQVHRNSVRANLTGVLRPEYLDVLTGTSRLAGLPGPVIELWTSQKYALDQGFLADDVGHRIVSMPTSAGKSLLAELAIVKALQDDPDATCIYVVPSRALVRQVEADLGRRLNPLGMTVSSAMGDFEFVDILEDFLLKRARVIVVTPERLSSLIRRQAGFLHTTRLVTYDEFHKIAEGQRGLIQEETLMALRSLKDLGIVPPRLLICSAVMSRTDELRSWLSEEAGTSEAIVSGWRPTRSILSVCWHQTTGDWTPENRRRQERRSGRWYVNHRMPGQSNITMVFPDLPRISQSPQTIPGVFRFKLTSRRYEGSRRWSEVKADANTSAVAVQIAKALATRPGTVLVYSPRPSWAVSLAKKLAEELPLKQDAQWGHRLSRTLTEKHPLVSRLAPKGVAYHHGRVPDEVREAIEETTGAKGLKVLVATPSLLEGVNLPITYLVIAQPVRIRDNRTEPLDLRSFMNLVGRAGRAMRETEGVVVLIEDPADAAEGNFTYERFIGLSEDETARQLEVHSFLEQLLTVTDEELRKEDNDVVEQMKTMIMAFEGLGLAPERVAARSLAAAYQDRDIGEVVDLFGRTSRAVGEVVAESDRKQLFSISGLPLRDCRRLYGQLFDWAMARPLLFARTRSEDGRVDRELLQIVIDLAILMEGTKPKSTDVAHLEVLDRWLHGSPMPELASLFLPQGKNLATATADEVEDAVSDCADYVSEFVRYKLPWATNAAVLFWAALTSGREDVLVDSEFMFLPAYIKAGVSTRAGAACATLGIRDRIVAEIVGKAYHGRYTVQLFSVRHFVQWFNRLDLPQIQQLDLDDFGKGLLLEASRRYAGRLLRSVAKYHRVFVAGVQYYNPELLLRIRVGDSLVLRREPTNGVDPNAVEVIYRNVKLGYVQKEEAPAVSSWLEGDLVVEAKVVGVATHGSMNRRVLVEITLLEVQ